MFYQATDSNSEMSPKSSTISINVISISIIIIITEVRESGLSGRDDEPIVKEKKKGRSGGEEKLRAQEGGSAGPRGRRIGRESDGD